MEKNTVLEYLEVRKEQITKDCKAATHETSEIYFEGMINMCREAISWLTSQPVAPAPLSAEEIEKAVRQMDMTIVALALSIPQDVWTDVKANWLTAKEALLSQRQSSLGAEDDLLRYIQKLLPVAAKELEAIEYSSAFQTITLARLIQKVEEYTLLSQRQPVAPEREEAGTDRQKALSWFHNLPTDEYDYYFEKHYPEKGPMSDEEVEAIWRKEGKPNAPKEETVGYYFSNEHGNEVTVLSTVGEWCLVSEEGKNKPYVLPLEFIEAIRNDASPSAENKGASGSADGLSKKGGEG